jgi:hypothetical protein
MYEDPCVNGTWPYISSCAYSTYRPGQLLICRPRPIKLRPTPPTPANSVYSVQLRTAASTVTGIHIEFSTRALLLGSLFDPLVRYFFFGNPFPLLRSSSCKPSNHRCLSEHRHARRITSPNSATLPFIRSCLDPQRSDKYTYKNDIKATKQVIGQLAKPRDEDECKVFAYASEYLCHARLLLFRRLFHCSLSRLWWDP